MSDLHISDDLLKFAKAKYNCRRGIKELDYLFGSILDRYFKQDADIIQDRFLEIINQNEDWPLMQWITKDIADKEPVNELIRQRLNELGKPNI